MSQLKSYNITVVHSFEADYVVSAESGDEAIDIVTNQPVVGLYLSELLDSVTGCSVNAVLEHEVQSIDYNIDHPEDTDETHPTSSI